MEAEFEANLGTSSKKSVDLRADEARRSAEQEEARRLESAKRAEEEARRRAEEDARYRADQVRRQQLLEQRERERQQEMSSSARSLPVTSNYVSAIARAPQPTVRSPVELVIASMALIIETYPASRPTQYCLAS